MSERASKRWVREREQQNNQRDPWYANESELRRKYAAEIDRIDAAEARFEACSEAARWDSAKAIARSLAEDWSRHPNWWEALADVACGIDRRAQGECPVCSRMTKPICDTAKEASDAT